MIIRGPNKPVQVRTALIQNSGISIRGRMLLIYVLSFELDEMPNEKEIIKELRLSPWIFRQLVKELEEKGYVKTNKTPGAFPQRFFFDEPQP